MKRHALLLGIFLSFLSLIYVASAKPNVILIITDDQGYGDIGAHGNPTIQTPHLDRLHAESIRFTDFHVDPTCSPTRGALLSGKYSHRAKVWHTIAAGNHLRASEMTMADVFKANGYNTAMFGKWHLGANYPYRPMDRGFEEWLGQGDGGTGTTDDYFTNDRVNDHYLHNGEWVYREGYAPEVFFDAAIDYVKEEAESEKPFFIYLSTYIPHGPHTLADRSWADKYMDNVDKPVAYFFAAIERVDQRIGRLRNALEETGLEKDTLVMFMTDNGGTAGVNLFNAGMKGRKGSPYDGGHRVPFFMYWPNGNFKHGKDVSDLTAHFDVLPTLVDLLNLETPEKANFDGRSFKRQLFQPDLAFSSRTLMVEKQRTFQPQKWDQAAAMTNQWRLVNNNELYDIRKDPGQERNVIDQFPEVVENLRSAFDDYWEHVSPGDRDRAIPIVGHQQDPETYLHSSDWYLEAVPWNHMSTSQGRKFSGDWHIRTEKAGTYQFEVRRWPREANGPIAGIPDLEAIIDAWDPRGAKRHLIYGNDKDPFVALPVASIRLMVGNFDETRSVSAQDTHITFDVPLNKDKYKVTAQLLDAEGQLITGAYYTYCRRLAN